VHLPEVAREVVAGVSSCGEEKENAARRIRVNDVFSIMFALLATELNHCCSPNANRVLLPNAPFQGEIISPPWPRRGSGSPRKSNVTPL
jgi:hypothetical protein